MPALETADSVPSTESQKADALNKTDIGNNGVAGQVCSNCGTTKTPLWRRGADGKATCNACGLYFRANNTHRPVHLKKPPHVIALSREQLAPGTCKGDGRCNGTGGSSACTGCPAFDNRVLLPSINSDVVKNEEEATVTESTNDSLAVACSNCSTTITPLWRRDDAGNTICNACGLYYRLHKTHRPVTYKRQTIKRRKRNPTSQQLSDVQQQQQSQEQQVSSQKVKQEAAHRSPHPSFPQQIPLPPVTQGQRQGSSIQQITPVTTPESKILDSSRVLPPLGSSTQLPPLSMIGRFQNNLRSIPAIDFTSIYSRTSHAEQSSLRTGSHMMASRSQGDHFRKQQPQQKCTNTRPVLANLMNPGKDEDTKT